MGRQKKRGGRQNEPTKKNDGRDKKIGPTQESVATNSFLAVAAERIQCKFTVRMHPPEILFDGPGGHFVGQFGWAVCRGGLVRPRGRAAFAGRFAVLAGSQ